MKDWRYYLSKTLAVILIAFGLYHIFASIISILFIFPRASEINQQIHPQVKMNLVTQALIIYTTTVVDGLFGYRLLTKSAEDIQAYHFVAGGLLLFFSFLLASQTPFTTDALLIILLSMFQ